MIRFLKFVVLVICMFVINSNLFAQRHNNTTINRFVPKDGYTLVFCGQNNKDCDEYVKINKKVPAGFMFYTSLADLSDLEIDTDFGSGKMSGRYFLKKYQSTSLQVGLYLVGSLQLVINGTLDENIKKLGAWIKQTKVPVFLRIGYEFDLLENKYDPELYKQAFRYIVEKLDEQNITNVCYVWHSCASFNSNKIASWYPGDEYVDWCAISYFSHSQWIPMLKFAQNHNKPLMIAECAPLLNRNFSEENKQNWYKTLFKFIKNNNVKAISYLNANWNEQPMFSKRYWGNTKLSATKEIKQLWLENISDERFINADRLQDNIYMELQTVEDILNAVQEQLEEQAEEVQSEENVENQKTSVDENLTQTETQIETETSIN